MDKLTIRASSVYNFYNNARQWYENHILGMNKFEGNTNTYLGTCCHKFAECYFTLEPYDYEEILKGAPEDVDKEHILLALPELEKVISEYLATIEAPTLTEYYLRGKESEHFITSGNIDAFYKDRGALVDYKTSGMKKSNLKDYRPQLNIYAYLLHINGYECKTLRVVLIVKATKTLPPRVFVLEEPANIEEGKKMLEYMVKKGELAMRNPEFAELIFSPNPYAFNN